LNGSPKSTIEVMTPDISDGLLANNYSTYNEMELS